MTIVPVVLGEVTAVRPPPARRRDAAHGRFPGANGMVELRYTQELSAWSRFVTSLRAYGCGGNHIQPKARAGLGAGGLVVRRRVEGEVVLLDPLALVPRSRRFGHGSSGRRPRSGRRSETGSRPRRGSVRPVVRREGTTGRACSGAAKLRGQSSCQCSQTTRCPAGCVLSMTAGGGWRPRSTCPSSTPRLR